MELTALAQQGLYGLKPRFRAALTGAADWLAARRVHPDGLTAAGVAASAAAGLCLALAGRDPWLALLVAPLLAARIALNALDGLVAERRGMARPWGAVLNEMGDRAADLALFAGLALLPGAPLLVIALAAAATLLASHAALAVAATGAARPRGGPMGKADRAAVIALAALATGLLGDLSILHALPSLLLVGGIATLLLRLWTARDAG
jgi:CDP-diacylglycerol--glycerol-3-phosphate 3-phosphatidyltransferase